MHGSHTDKTKQESRINLFFLFFLQFVLVPSLNLWLGDETAGKLARRGRSLAVCVHANAAHVHAKLRPGYKERRRKKKKKRRTLTLIVWEMSAVEKPVMMEFFH